MTSPFEAHKGTSSEGKKLQSQIDELRSKVDSDIQELIARIENSQGGVVGPGTANYVPYWITSNRLGNSPLWNDVSEEGGGWTFSSSLYVPDTIRALDIDVDTLLVNNGAHFQSTVQIDGNASFTDNILVNSAIDTFGWGVNVAGRHIANSGGVGLYSFGVGTPSSSVAGNSEAVRLIHFGTEYRVQGTKTGTGVYRDLVLHTNNAAQLTCLAAGGVTVANAFTASSTMAVTGISTLTGNVNINGATNSSNYGLNVASKHVSVSAGSFYSYGVGVPGGTNIEFIQLRHSGTLGEIYVDKSGSGTYRELYIYTSGAAAVRINTSGGMAIGANAISGGAANDQILSVSGAASAAQEVIRLQTGQSVGAAASYMYILPRHRNAAGGNIDGGTIRFTSVDPTNGVRTAKVGIYGSNNEVQTLGLEVSAAGIVSHANTTDSTASTNGGATFAGGIGVLKAIQTASFVLSELTAKPQYVLNSVGSNYGYVGNTATGIWALGYNTSATSLGTSVLTWSSGGVVTVPGTFNVTGAAAFGTTTSTEAQVKIRGSAMTDATAYGISCAPTFPSSVGTLAAAGYFQANTAVSGISVSQLSGIYIGSCVIGGSGAGLVIGLDIAAQTGGSTASAAIRTSTGQCLFGDLVTCQSNLIVTGSITGGSFASSSGGAYETGTFTVTLTGVTASVTGTARWVRVGSAVTLYIPNLTGTSNTTACTITGLPASIQPARTWQIGVCEVEDNGLFYLGSLQVTASSTMTLYRITSATSGNSSTFTNSGTKGLTAQAPICYHIL